ncbi:MAG: hypothetical protein M1814_002090 [Vezdaea aestivalis]|nr:MAG: hypothetical protein M1814_002090 [Vezdaea aestivalis]
MSASTSSHGFSAPWKATFESHISKQPSPEFMLATVTSEGDPRLRTLIYRGMWCALPPNKHNDAPKNPQVYETNMPVFTTDVRMEKAGQIEATGGKVEAMWWITETKTQWRIKGKAFVIGAKGEHEESVRKEVLKKMKVTGNGLEKDWDWEREFTGHFGNLSPMMKGSFKNPPCGSPKSEVKETPEFHQGQKIMDLEDPIARSNFRVVTIDPLEVEQLDLTEGQPAQRYIYRYVGQDKNRVKDGQELLGEWTKEEKIDPERDVSSSDSYQRLCSSSVNAKSYGIFNVGPTATVATKKRKKQSTGVDYANMVKCPGCSFEVAVETHTCPHCVTVLIKKRPRPHFSIQGVKQSVPRSSEGNLAGASSEHDSTLGQAPTQSSGSSFPLQVTAKEKVKQRLAICQSRETTVLGKLKLTDDKSSKFRSQLMRNSVEKQSSISIEKASYEEKTALLKSELEVKLKDIEDRNAAEETVLRLEVAHLDELRAALKDDHQNCKIDTRI